MKLFRAPINSEMSTRREAELSAVAAIIAREFGQGAIMSHDTEGRPLLNVDGCEMTISVSHCADEAVIAVAPAGTASIGVDVETAREQLRRVAPRFLTAEELAQCTSIHHLLRAWTAKEAVYKAAHTPGLPLNEIRLSSLNDDFAPAAAIAVGHLYHLSRPLDTPAKVITIALPA